MGGDLATGVLAGDRRALARAITLVESARHDHRAQAADLLTALAGSRRPASASRASSRRSA